MVFHKGFKHTEEIKRKISLNNSKYCKDKPRSEEVRKKISESRKRLFREGKLKISEEHRRKISLANTGRKLTIETRKKLSESRKGIKFSDEHKKKISEANKGRIGWNKGLTKENNVQLKKLSDYYKSIGGINNGKAWNKGLTKETNESLRKLSEKFKNRKCPWNKGKPRSYLVRLAISKANSGEKNGAWCGGKRLEKYGIGFNRYLKQKIRKRDNYRCQECNKSDYNLDIHHIDYNKKNNNLNNLISLCKSCHSKTNFNRINWTNYLKNSKGG